MTPWPPRASDSHQSRLSPPASRLNTFAVLDSAGLLTSSGAYRRVTLPEPALHLPANLSVASYPACGRSVHAEATVRFIEQPELPVLPLGEWAPRWCCWTSGLPKTVQESQHGQGRPRLPAPGAAY
jgi:hypothetical protein